MSEPATQSLPARGIAIIGPSAYAILDTFGTLIKTLASKRQRVLILAASSSPAADRLSAELGARIATFPLSPDRPRTISDRASVDAMTKVLRAENIHAAITVGMKSMALGATAARRAGAQKIIVRTAALSEREPNRDASQLGWRWRWLLSAGLNAADIVLCTTIEEQRTLAVSGLLKSVKRLSSIPVASVDLEFFSPTPIPSVSDGIVFLGLCGNSRVAGAVDFVRAAAAVRGLSSSARVIITGPAVDPPDGLTAQELIAADAPVEYVPDPTDVRALLARSHVVVDTSQASGNPSAIARAMACARPVIATDVPANRATIDAKVNGVLVPPDDVPSLIGAMESILRRPELVAPMARASRSKAERWFDSRIVDAQLIAELGLG